jgi:hypothetical protein
MVGSHELQMELEPPIIRINAYPADCEFLRIRVGSIRIAGKNAPVPGPTTFRCSRFDMRIGLVSAMQLLRLAANGVTIGSHSLTHCPLTEADDRRLLMSFASRPSPFGIAETQHNTL